MSNSYIPSQPWADSHTNYPTHLQLEHEFDNNSHQSMDAYQYPQSQQQHTSFPHNQQSQTYASIGDSQFAQDIYGSTQDISHTSNAFNPTLVNQLSPEQHAYHSNLNPFDYEARLLSGTGLGTTGSSHNIFPPPQQPLAQRQPYYQRPSITTLESNPKVKRQRNYTLGDDTRDDDADMSADNKEGAKAKSLGACARCKNLKVKCEFKTETDPCKRCMNGGHDCVIPGRKKRRSPPKREHLLNQIREQATQIQNLMSQLEMTQSTPNRPARSVTSASHSPSPSLHSPILSPTSTNTDSYYAADLPPSNLNANPESNKAVEDWIAKARESLTEFGGLIGVGGAGMPKSYLVDQDPEGTGSSDDDEYVNVNGDLEGGDADDDNQEYEFAIEDIDGDDPVHSGGSPMKSLRHKSSGSSFSTNATGTTGGPRKRQPDERPAILPGEAVPFGLFGGLSLKTHKRRESSVEKEEGTAAGIANEDFFRSTPAPETLVNRLASTQQQIPYILARGVITPVEAEKLFNIYFNRMNLSVSLLDPVLYTAQRTFHRSPFLFTVICAIASRFYSERPELYGHAMHYAQLAAGTALISGQKCVELCQAYILLSLYPVPARRWEDQRSWLYLGLAIRVATDLNLHLPNTAKPLNENHAREMLNRTRVWLNCFNLDRSTGSQYGKPPIISSSDYMANHSKDWWKSSPHNMINFDIHISAYNSELKVMAGFLAKIYSDPDHPTGLNKDVDFEQVATETDDELKRLGDQWAAVLEQTDLTDPQNCFRTGLLKLAYSYARLISLSYGFQHSFGKGHTDENPFLMRCLSAATDIVSAVVDDICRPSQLEYFRHGPEAQCVFVTFASAFLVKLLQPRFASYLTTEKRLEIRGLVQKVVDLLGSPEVAIDERHGPKLYSRFLKGLLAAPKARVDPSGALPRPRTRRPKSASGPPSESGFEPTSNFSSPLSPAKSSSLSPPPNTAALSFDTFVPIHGGIDPFAPVAHGSSLNIDNANMSMTGYFEPSLPFNDDILQSMQSVSDPSGWQDISLPGFNWMTQFQQNLGLDMRSNDATMYHSNAVYASQ